MILDTTFLIDLLKDKKSAVEKMRYLESLTRFATTSVSIFELWRGFKTLDAEKMQKTNEFLDQLTIYTLERNSAQRAGKIAQELDRNGQMIDSEDSMIAGIALEKNERILTRNVKHFERIPNLKIETY